MKFLPRFFLTTFFLAAVFGAGCSGSNAGSADDGTSSGLGSTPLFILPNTQGKDVNLENVLKEHKAVLLNFWATWCPPCREEIPDLIRLQEKYGPRSFTVLGVNVGESSAKVSAFMDLTRINYPMVLDRKQKVSQQFRIVGIPTSLLVAQDGKVLGVYHAVTPDLFEDLEKALK